MSDYDQNCDKREYQHNEMLRTARPYRTQERSLSESVPTIKQGWDGRVHQFHNTPTQDNDAKQDRADLIKRLLISLVLLTIVIGVLKITGGQ